MATSPADITADDGYFAILPEWIIDADISAQAVRLYAVLRLYASHTTRQAHPSRRTLADRLRVKDEKVVDRALADLVSIHALRVVHRWRNEAGDISYTADEGHRIPTSNGYRLHTRPGGVWVSEGTPLGAQEPPGVGVPAPPGVGAQKGTKLDPVELDPFELHTPPRAAAGADTQTPTPNRRGSLDFNRGKRHSPPPADPNSKDGPDDTSGESWRDAAPPGFLAFWAAYPRREFPAHARAAWNRKGCEPHAAQIVAAAVAYAADPNRVPQYTTAPARWLDGEGWLNGPQPTRAPVSSRDAEEQRVDGIFARAAARAQAHAADALDALDATLSDERGQRALPAAPLPWEAS